MAETLEIAQDVARRLIESHVKHGDPLPRKVRSALRRAKRRAKITILVSSRRLPHE